MPSSRPSPPTPLSAPVLRVVHGGACSHPEDKALAARVVAGDRRAAGELYQRFVGRVDGTIYRVLGRREAEHEDLVQATFVQLVLSLRNYQGECSLATWASRVTANVAHNAIRSRRRARAVFAPEPLADEGPPGASLDPVAAMALRRALAEITPEKAETLLLHDMMGHDLVEIAATMGVTVAAAQSRLVRARRELREALSQAAPGEEGGRDAGR